MRKGRSQRKTRGSLPMSKRAPSRLDAAASGGSGGPQVVVGLTAPVSDESIESAVDARAEGRDPVESLETRARGAERLELVREKSLELVRESLELVRESLELQEQAAAQEPALTEEPAQAREPAAVESREPRVETLTFDARDPFQDEREEATAEATPAPAATPTPARQMSLPTPDEMSIPPVGDLSVEPIADRFFSEGELAASSGIDRDLQHEEWDHRAHKSVRKSLPEVVQRRARFAKYVRWAVGGAAVVCLAALARSVVPASPTSPASASLSTVGSRESQSRETSEAPVAKAAAAAVVAAEPVRAPESVAAPVVAVPAAAPAPPEAPAVAPVAAASDKTALQEKNDSRRALERGKLGDAIAAGERSVALDPTDGEAWLLLGAAYQEKGKNADARRCYTACTKEGKRGPVGECRAMIR